MKNKINEIMGILIAIAIIACCLLGSISFHAFNRNYFESEYQRLNTAASIGMSEEDLFEATDVLLDYLQDERDDIQVNAEIVGVEREVFNERETAHMVDVKNLWINVQRVVAVLAAIGVIAAIYLASEVIRKKCEFSALFKQLNNAFKQVSIAFVIIAAFLIGYALIDFTSFWTAFHELFFTNDLWLLNPATSIMINMFPESFFAGMVFRIAITFVLSYGCIVALTHFIYKKSMKKQRLSSISFE